MTVVSLVPMVLAVAAGMIMATTADARGKRDRHGHAAARSRPPAAAAYVPQRRVPIPYAYSFYPEEIEDGVSGNLPFNNQIRKFKDPLNANGGGG